jgi:Protein of unknown function (DUF3352)
MLDRRLPHGVRIAAPLALLLTLLLILAGCGEDNASPTTTAGPDPASVAPAGAALYGEAVVRPEGELEEGALAAARKVFRVEDPGAELRRLLEQDTAPGDLSFARDIEPWLGDRVGGFLLMPSAGAEDPDGAAAVAIGDRAAFDEALSRIRRREDLREAGRYRGVAYEHDPSDPDTYLAVVEDFVLVGTLVGVRAAIDAAEGSSLADASRFADAADEVPDNALAFAYVDPRPIVAAVRELPDLQDAIGAARRALDRFERMSPVVASLTANADEIAIEGSGDAERAGPEADDSDAEVSVGQLPGDAWLALATPPLGPALRAGLQGPIHDEVARQLRANTGLDLDRDVLEPLGGLGLFARGESPLDLGGGVLLQLTDAAAARRLLTRIQTLLAAGANLPVRPASAGGARGFQVQIPQSPQPIVVLAEGDKLAAGYAASSAEDLLDPQQRFDESAAGQAAIETLGDGYAPSLVLIVPPIAALLRALDQLEVAELSPVVPYVNAYRSLAIGTKRDDDRVTVRIVAALR